ncbi:MAG: YceI family protein [Bacteroidota bacterium]|nr:YceI family protein [Bacteroidota bacterium]
MIRFVALFFVLLGIAQVASAQTAYKVGAQPVMTLYGTSTLHNWTMTAHAFACNAQFGLTGDNQLTSISGLSFSLPVHNLKSEHDGMNDNAYDALKADKYKDIVFKLTSAKVTSTGANKFQIMALGNLSIAGTTRPVTLTAAALVNADGSVSCSGTVPLKLSEYNIQRPTFMLGTMSVGDALTLNYALVFVK